MPKSEVRREFERLVEKTKWRPALQASLLLGFVEALVEDDEHADMREYFDEWLATMTADLMHVWSADAQSIEEGADALEDYNEVSK